MTVKSSSKTITAVIIDEQPLSLFEICQILGTPAETIMEMVEYGIVEPVRGRSAKNWQFSTEALRRSRVAIRLQRDLNVNLEGLGVALNLLEEVQQLRRRVQFLQERYPER